MTSLYFDLRLLKNVEVLLLLTFQCLMNVLIFFFNLKNIKRDDYLKPLCFLLAETSNFMLDT